MAQLVTLEKLMARVRSRADMPVGGIVSDAELVDYINEAARRLYASRVLSDRDSFVVRAALTLAPDNVALPADFMDLVSVEASIGDGNFTRLRRANLQDESPDNTGLHRFCARQTYALEEGLLYCQPNPPPYLTLRVRYVPSTWGKTAGGAKINELTNPTDTIDCVNGWDRLVILDAAIMCRIKEESDHRDLDAERAKIEGEVMREADDRDSAQPRTVIDTKSGNGYGDGW